MTGSEDVTVIGAGPAGLAVAIGAAMRGMRVVVRDIAKQAPLDKACGEGLLPGAVSALQRLGVRLPSGHRLAGIRFLHGPQTAEARFTAATGLGLRRTELHRAMLARADDLGIRFAWGTHLHHLPQENSRFIIGADGARSRVRLLAGLDRGRTSSRRIGLRRHFAVQPWSPMVEVFWGDRLQAYVTPVGPCEVGVAVVSTGRMQMDEALTHFPALRQRLASAATTSTARGAATVTHRLLRVTAANVALVGDASGSVDAITGQGISLCLRQAEVLVQALVSGSLASYQDAHPSLMRTARAMSAALLLMDRSTILRHAALALLAGVPAAFDTLLHLHAAGPSRNPQPAHLPPLALPGKLDG